MGRDNGVWDVLWIITLSISLAALILGIIGFIDRLH